MKSAAAFQELASVATMVRASGDVSESRRLGLPYAKSGQVVPSDTSSGPTPNVVFTRIDTSVHICA
jgi:hypothetical protein